MPDQKNRSNTLYFQIKHAASTTTTITTISSSSSSSPLVSHDSFVVTYLEVEQKNTHPCAVHGVLRNHSCQSRTLGLFSGNALYLSYF
ncbi:uncharacterized protein LOC116842095 isoform X3 [Odontomachus brunneus]|uniref:uncharacterized protein LOC116842095 isoform X3 n=1 Tax=Odontomachus brunneus TaxID=486640 RepID=UPI0013F2AB29|nr:uncharacterized protein LOC116842095 isoform X3 [Odontomachus brunneus]